MGGGGGTTSTTGVIPAELQPLYRGSVARMLGQQNDNPIGQYNEANPLQVAGADPLMQAGASTIAGGALPGGLEGLSLQSLLRMPGLAGAGPTTGSYDYGSEAGLGDIMSFLNPRQGTGGNMKPLAGMAGEGYGNATPQPGDAPMSFDGLDSAFGDPKGAYGGQPNMYPGQVGLPTGNEGTYGGGDDLQHPGMPPGIPGGESSFKPTAPPAGYKSLFSQNQSDFFGGDPRQKLSDMGFGISNSGENGGQTTFSKDGSSYLNQGASHEGGGFGGQSKFLSDLGFTPGSGQGGLGDKAYGGDLGKTDKMMASVAQQNRLEQTKKFKSGQESAAQVAARKASAMGTKLPPKKKS